MFEKFYEIIGRAKIKGRDVSDYQTLISLVRIASLRQPDQIKQVVSDPLVWDTVKSKINDLLLDVEIQLSESATYIEVVKWFNETIDFAKKCYIKESEEKKKPTKKSSKEKE